MKRILIGTIIVMMLVLPSLSVLGFGYHHERTYDATTNTQGLFEEDENVTIAISQAPFYLGINIDIGNQGITTLTDIKWSFRAKPLISGEGNVRRSNFVQGTIDQLEPDETTTIKLRPFRRTTPSPIGLSITYMNASVYVGDNFARTSARANLISFFLFGFRETYLDIKPDEAYSKLTNGTFDLVIDVVGLDIYSQGHLPGAVNYIWADGTLQSEIPNLDKNWTYLVYCHTDPPSTASAQALIDAGINKVYRLEGNYRAWVDAGHPIET